MFTVGAVRCEDRSDPRYKFSDQSRQAVTHHRRQNELPGTDILLNVITKNTIYTNDSTNIKHKI